MKAHWCGAHKSIRITFRGSFRKCTKYFLQIWLFQDVDKYVSYINYHFLSFLRSSITQYSITFFGETRGVGGAHAQTAVISNKAKALLQPLRWRCVDCAIYHERDVRGQKHYIYVARTNNNRVISSGDLYCCLVPQCEALRTCRSGFPIATAYNALCKFSLTLII